jgi:predicted ArsR family transcriptional regulator
VLNFLLWSKHMTNTSRILEALMNGEQLTTKQISARFGVVSARGAIHTLRSEGFPIYLNKHTDTKGRVTNKYRLGKASRKVVAAGYKALGVEAFA